MKFAVIVAAILSSISRAGCFVTTSHGSLGRAPDSLIAKRSPLEGQDCTRVPFPQCSGGHYHPAGFQVRVIVNRDFVLVACQV
jgi:hypothetical protein